METQLLGGCRRLVEKGFFETPANSFSLRIPGASEMIVASGLQDWRRIGKADLQTVSLNVHKGLSGLHASIYQQRADVGAVAISSPKGVCLLARLGGQLPPLFDEQVRHIGPHVRLLEDGEKANEKKLRKTFGRGANAALLGEQLLCLGMTCDRVLFNTELMAKCCQAYVIARASGSRIGRIPVWVRIIANHRLLKDERRAAASYRNGVFPEGIRAY